MSNYQAGYEKPLWEVLAFIFFIGFISGAGLKLANWVIPSAARDVNLIVCIDDGSANYKGCAAVEELKQAWSERDE